MIEQQTMLMPAKVQRSAATLTCHGCRHCWYSAPGGQAWNRQPHSRCTALKLDVPMILGDREKWLGSEVPRDCPEHRQPELI